MRIGILTVVTVSMLVLSGCGSHDAKVAEFSFSGGPADGHDFEWYKAHPTDAKAERDFCNKKIIDLSAGLVEKSGVKTQGLSEKEVVSNMTPEMLDEARKKIPAYCSYADDAISSNNFFGKPRGHY
ncbi:MAG: hypothetical protein HOP20_10510 [Sulfuriferula sp.]|nr:hypothetical protein [Sulfuriferula sp.]